MNNKNTDIRLQSYLIIRNFLKTKQQFKNIYQNHLDKLDLQTKDKNFIRELTTGIVRHYYYLFYKIYENIASKTKIDNDSFALLLIGAYQLLYMNSVPDYAAVNTTVDISKSQLKNKSNFINAILRKINVKDKVSIKPNIEHSFPLWLYNMYLKQFGPNVSLALMKAQNITY